MKKVNNHHLPQIHANDFLTNNSNVLHEFGYSSSERRRYFYIQALILKKYSF
jgi:hypothetical protein